MHALASETDVIVIRVTMEAVHSAIFWKQMLWYAVIGI